MELSIGRNNMQIEKLTNFDKFYIASLFYYCFLINSSIFILFPILYFPWFFGIRVIIACVLVIFVVQQQLKWGYFRVNKFLFVLSFLFFLTAFLPSLYHTTTFLLLRVFIDFYFTYMFFLLYKKKYLSPLVNIATVFMFTVIIFAIIGFVYAFIGNRPTMVVPFRTSFYYWYLTTGTNSSFGGIIRPGGIYDEPGTLSYFICLLCFLRVFSKKNDGVTFVLLLLGNITFSMIHAMIFVLFILYLVFKYKKKKAFVFYTVLVFVITLAMYIPLRETIDDRLLARFEGVRVDGGQVTGMNRAYLFNNELEFLREDFYNIFLWGAPRGNDGLTIIHTERRFGESPLTFLVRDGIFIAWLYYFFLSFFLLCSVIDKKRFFIYISIFLMLLQRQAFFSFGTGSGAAVLILFLTGLDLIKRRLDKMKWMFKSTIYVKAKK